MLSVQELESLSESDVGRTLFDRDGLTGTVRIESHPSQRIVVDFNTSTDSGGLLRKVGTWPDQSLAAIRSRALKAQGDVRIAPEQPRRRAMAALRSAQTASHHSVPVASTMSLPADANLTVVELFEHWHRVKLSARKDAGESVQRSMLKDVLPHLGAMHVSHVQSQHVVEVLTRIVDRGSARQAGCVLSDLRQMFRWALDEGWIDDDPTSTLRKTELCGVQQPRSRTLSHAEVKELSARMSAAGLARHIRRATWLMLATGARIGELAHARWRDVDLQAATWTIPAEFSHSGHAHTVPLSAFAVRHLQSETGLRSGSDWVFPGRNGSEPLSPKALGKQIRDRQRGTQIRGRSAATKELLLSGGAWTPLDLRRTAASLMRDAGVTEDVISACLDHGARSPHSSSPAGNQAMLTADCREAFNLLGQWLESIERPQARSERLAA